MMFPSLCHRVSISALTARSRPKSCSFSFRFACSTLLFLSVVLGRRPDPGRLLFRFFDRKEDRIRLIDWRNDCFMFPKREIFPSWEGSTLSKVHLVTTCSIFLIINIFDHSIINKTRAGIIAVANFPVTLQLCRFLTICQNFRGTANSLHQFP